MCQRTTASSVDEASRPPRSPRLPHDLGLRRRFVLRIDGPHGPYVRKVQSRSSPYPELSSISCVSPMSRRRPESFASLRSWNSYWTNSVV